MKQVKYLILIFGVALLIMSIGTVSSSHAKRTPDGQTPTEESVCNGQIGAAFGLCNAYCEAMDCDSNHPQASRKACEKVRNNYIKITGYEMPCLLPPGPDDCCNRDIDDPACHEFWTQCENGEGYCCF